MKGMLLLHGEDLGIKLLDVRAEEVPAMEWCRPCSGNIINLKLRLPKATSRLISCRLEATATAETTPFLDTLAMILTCS